MKGTSHDPLQQRVKSVVANLSETIRKKYPTLLPLAKKINSTFHPSHNGWNEHKQFHLDLHTSKKISLQINYTPLFLLEILSKTSAFSGSFDHKHCIQNLEYKTLDSESNISKRNPREGKSAALDKCPAKKLKTYESLKLTRKGQISMHSKALAIPYGLSRRDKCFKFYHLCKVLDSKSEKDGKYFKVAFKSKRLTRHNLKKQWIPSNRIISVHEMLYRIINQLNSDNKYRVEEIPNIQQLVKIEGQFHKDLSYQISKDLKIEVKAIENALHVCLTMNTSGVDTNHEDKKSKMLTDTSEQYIAPLQIKKEPQKSLPYCSGYKLLDAEEDFACSLILQPIFFFRD